MIALCCAALLTALDIEVRISMSMSAAAWQKQEETTNKCGKSSCDCGCREGEVCRCAESVTKNLYWVKTPNGQSGLFDKEKQIGIWDGQYYWPIKGSQLGVKRTEAPIKVPQVQPVTHFQTPSSQLFNLQSPSFQFGGMPSSVYCVGGT